MFTRCIVCRSRLGLNASIKHFPFGRRLAFDSEHGRLWVICAHCGMWNLAPLEERWEAVEECEQRHRAVRTAITTQSIDLARLSDGTELIRIGKAQRAELTGWRYGRRLVRRYHRFAFLAAMGSATAASLAVFGGSAAILALPALPALAEWGTAAARLFGASNWRSPFFIRSSDRSHWLSVRRRDFRKSRFQPGSPGHQWSLMLPHELGAEILSCGAARAALTILLPLYNRGGATRRAVDLALSDIDEAGSPEQYVEMVVSRATVCPPGVNARIWRARGPTELDLIDRLGLEIALNDSMEARAMAGELETLERAWRDAEEVAAIADDLLIPSSVREKLSRLRHP